MLNFSQCEYQLSDIRDKMLNGEIIPDPDWQRGYVWKPKDEKLLIDSIIQGIPIPKFYFTEEYDEDNQKMKYNVIDGQQRLTTIKKFLLLLRTETSN